MHKNKVFLLTVSLFFILPLISQNNTNSPYTRYGLGELTETNSGEQRAMGGLSLGLRSKTDINTVNPASYSVVDSTTFMFDIGISALYSRFTELSNRNKTSFNSNLEYVTMLFPLSKNIGFSAGLLPYSFSGYNFYLSDSTTLNGHGTTSDTIGFTESFYGSGGISQVYSGLAIKFFDRISLGVNAYYMFGKVNNNRLLTFNQTTGFYSALQTNDITVRNFRFRYGLQYFDTYAGKHDVSLGLIYEQKANLNGEYMQSTSGVTNDTTPQLPSDKDFELPQTFGLGLSYTYNKQVTVGLDYTLQQWGDAKFFGKSDSLSNRSKIVLGGEYVPDIKGRKYSDRIRYRAGLNLSDSYIKVNGNVPPQNFGITFGVGLPLKNSNTLVNASFEYGKIGTSSLLREDYFKFTFNAAFNELWFFKRKL